MNTIIHDIRHVFPNAVVYPVRWSILLVSLDMGRFGVGRIYIGAFMKHSLSCDASWGRAIDDEWCSVLSSCSRRSPCGPLPPCHPPNGENTKAWDWISDDDSNLNDRWHSWVIKKSISSMEKAILDVGDGEKKPFSLERKILALKYEKGTQCKLEF